MSRSSLSKVVAVAIGLVLPACKSAQGPSAGPSAPAPPAEVQQLVGQTRILRHRGHEGKITLKHADLARLGGGCDAAVEVRQASLEGGTLRLTLAHLGRPNLPAKPRVRGAACTPVPSHALVVTQAGSANAFSSAIDVLLPTPEEYLKAGGTPFEREAGKAPAVAAADGPGTTGEERSLAFQVKTWPVVLLAVDTDVDVGKQVGGRESEVDFVGVVGTDGRLYAPKVVTPLSDEHVKELLRTFSIWRYQPARSATAEMPAKVSGKAVLRLY
jgi:hypothetical protein